MEEKIYHVVLGESELYTMDKECALSLRDNYGATVETSTYRKGGVL